jgi:hypothetical protein
MKIVLVFTLLTFCIQVPGQKYTWFGGGIGLISASGRGSTANPVHSTWLLDGGSYGGFIRQDITKFLSFEIGFSYRNFGCDFRLSSGQTVYSNVGFPAYQVPVNIDLEVDVMDERISFHSSFGYLFKLYQYTGPYGTIMQYSIDGDSLIYNYKYLPASEYSSHFIAGAGARFRLIDQLRFELELVYIFRFNDIREYDITTWDEAGNPEYGNEIIHGNYWHLQAGFSFPVQRLIKMIREGSSEVRKQML